ncbi:FadR family transcriptional regulator [Oceanispirochaeta crateris]|uniref:FadR family transcriptional regulator n=1 Tax=Oceanispirochaeta crateris TaxID=2518645 RepID=A0A5C1QMT4_9SPIO|nr:FCD domain-containing protein [Oceanispirochaeta crateris]QEN08270.1 FadR family transcriptional regulator [Oceanispirochaeta crateris]
MSKIDHVMMVVKKQILDGSYKKGDKLPSELEIMEMCGTSRSSVREAIKVLSTVGLVEIRRGLGTFVKNDLIETKNVANFQMTEGSSRTFTNEQLLEYRKHIEGLLLEMVILNCSDEDINKLEQQNDQLKMALGENPDPLDLYQIDIDFHLEIGRLTHNPLMEQLNENLVQLIKSGLREDYLNIHYAGFLSYVNHQQMIDAIRNRDIELAKQTVIEVNRTFLHRQ